MAEKHLTHVGDGNFAEEILKADKPALVDFWAPWCGPCKAIGPLVEALADQYHDQVKVAKINIDDNPKTAANLRREEHPDPDPLQGGEGSRYPHRPGSEGTPGGVHQEGPVDGAPKGDDRA